MEEEGKRRRGFTGGEELGGGGFLDSLSRSWWSGAFCCVTDRQISSFLFLVGWMDWRIWGILEFLAEQNVLFTSVLLHV